jgi:hypothetical protein
MRGKALLKTMNTELVGIVWHDLEKGSLLCITRGSDALKARDQEFRAIYLVWTVRHFGLAHILWQSLPWCFFGLAFLSATLLVALYLVSSIFRAHMV